jgi:NAD(P)-dependent dehydrogenase (short-subunit alcohol dehydrogenase family)
MAKPRKSIFITGAAAGIGRAVALRFAADGWVVGLYDINLPGVKALASEIGPQAIAGKLDVSDAAAFAKALASFTQMTGGTLDVLFNNAGILATGDFESMPIARAQALVDVNTKGVMHGCHAAQPYLKATPGSRVINMASASAIYGTPAFAVYSATKFFVRGFTEALNIEWARFGIYVCDLLPLFVDTPMVAGVTDKPDSIKNLGVRLSADDIANTVYEAAHVPRWRGTVHWHVGRQTQALAVLNKYMPTRLARLSNKLLSGY